MVEQRPVKTLVIGSSPIYPASSCIFTCYTFSMKEKPKLYVVQKYVMAVSAQAALRKEKKVAAHDVWIDNNWKEKQLTEAIGFHVDHPVEDED